MKYIAFVYLLESKIKGFIIIDKINSKVYRGTNFIKDDWEIVEDINKKDLYSVINFEFKDK